MVCYSDSANTCDEVAGQCKCGSNPTCSGSMPKCDTSTCVACTNNGECPAWLPRCDGGTCKCGTITDCDPNNKQLVNTCSSSDESGTCVCGSTSASCTENSQLGKCRNNAEPPIFVLGDIESTCKVNMGQLKLIDLYTKKIYLSTRYSKNNVS